MKWRVSIMTVSALEIVDVKHQIKGYARTLYINYRARVMLSGRELPAWEHASPAVRREFIRDARIAFGY